MTNPPTYIAIDPRNGAQLRPATPAEVAAYEAQPGRPGVTIPILRRSWFVAVRVGDVLIDEVGEAQRTGQGGWDWL
jgi:hypothetical protein